MAIILILATYNIFLFDIAWVLHLQDSTFESNTFQLKPQIFPTLDINQDAHNNI